MSCQCALSEVTYSELSHEFNLACFSKVIFICFVFQPIISFSITPSVYIYVMHNALNKYKYKAHGRLVSLYSCLMHT